VSKGSFNKLFVKLVLVIGTADIGVPIPTEKKVYIYKILSQRVQ